MKYRGTNFHYSAGDTLDPLLRASWVELDADKSTRAWIDDAMENPSSAMTLVARKVALKVMSDYDANGLTGAHDMRVLGTAQWQQMLRRETKVGRCLDVGAGDGHVTAELEQLFEEIVTTELSRNMVKRLQERGYVCHRKDLAEDDVPGAPYDAIALLNVIDRTPLPLTLLERAKQHLRTGGLLLLAVPVPLSPHVHVGPMTVSPDEMLPVLSNADRKSDDAFERSVNALMHQVFIPLGFLLRSVGRAPYLCRGDARNPVHQLDDAIFVLERP